MAKRSQFRMTNNTAKRIERVRFVREVDDCPDLSYLGSYSDTPEKVHIDRQKRGDMGRGEYRYFNAGCGDPAYIRQDYKRYEAYNRGDWGMTYCHCTAEVYVAGVRQEVSSGGLGGVESDSGATYFEEIKSEELRTLAGILGEMGFSQRQIKAAFEKCEDVEV